MCNKSLWSKFSETEILAWDWESTELNLVSLSACETGFATVKRKTPTVYYFKLH